MGSAKDRKKKLIQRGLQLRLVSVFLCMSVVASLFQVVLLNRSIMDLSRRLPAESDALMAVFPSLLTANLVTTMLILLPMTFLVGIVVTHRIAGPAHRMETYLKSVAAGERPGPCRIRSDDELGDLCSALNRALASVMREHGEEEAAKKLDVDSVSGPVKVSPAEEEVEPAPSSPPSKES
jgi:nitrogen fixation/metabolism regulation signal transduction histidine kinase